MEIFGLNEASEKKTTESTNPSFSLDEMSSMAARECARARGRQERPLDKQKRFHRGNKTS